MTQKDSKRSKERSDRSNVNIDVTLDLKGGLQAIADGRKMTLSALIKEVLYSHVDHRELILNLADSNNLDPLVLIDMVLRDFIDNKRSLTIGGKGES